MGVPRNATLAETIYRGIERNEYLNRIYADLLYNYSLKLFSLRQKQKEVDVGAALRFADILSKSAYTENAEVHKIWAQEIVILLNILYPDDTRIKPYLGSVLSAVGNYRGLMSAVKDYSSTDIFDRIFYGYEKELLAIPGVPDAFFFPAQKIVYDGLGKQCFSYSGPTSMGKSFVVQTYIKQQVEAGEKKNYAILVPTKALINEVRSNIIKELNDALKERNYRVVASAGDIVLQQNHHFVFVMTPERMHHLLNTMPEMMLDFLFVDEAHKISAKGGRSAFYYKVIHDVTVRERKPSIVFASPNIPNPEVYLNLIPGIKQMEIRKLASKFAPVCQFKYLVDMTNGQIYSHNGHSNTLNLVRNSEGALRVIDVVSRVGKDKQNIVYCNSRTKVVKFAKDYADSIQLQAIPSEAKEKLESLAKDITNEVHSACFLAELVRKGVAYHVGYLPASIRLRIEKSFEEGLIRTMFCTSTLVEGVNLPADNLFITSYRNGKSGMDEVGFRNLVGRVGRIKYNLYGNVFMLAFDESEKVTAKKVAEKYESLLNNEIPKQYLSVEGNLTEKQRRAVVTCLAQGDVEMRTCLESEKADDYSAMRKFALILTRDLVNENTSTVTEAFSSVLDDSSVAAIRHHFGNNRTSDDITLSYDQWENLTDAINCGLSYPFLTGEDDTVDFDRLVSFLATLRHIFKWDVYESSTIGKISQGFDRNAVLRWYATVLMQWIRGKGLSTIIQSALTHKKNHPNEGIWSGRFQIERYYNDRDAFHKNYVIAETLDVIENVILFSISNYFRKFSLEYKRIHQVDHFDNDWYEYVEYGTTNPLTIFLQQSGFSRETSQYIIRHKNKYIIENNGEIKINLNILECGDIGTETEAADIQFNVPELFVPAENNEEV